MRAYFKQDTKKSDAIWLVIDRGKKSPNIDGIMGMFRDEDESESVAYPILKDDISLIYQACKKYLKRKCQKKLKNT